MPIIINRKFYIIILEYVLVSMLSTFGFKKNKIINVTINNKPTICKIIACIFSHPFYYFLFNIFGFPPNKNALLISYSIS